MSGCTADVSVAADRARLVAAASSAFGGRLDIFVNNAGKNIRKKTVEYSLEEFEDVMGTNFTPAFELCKARVTQGIQCTSRGGAQSRQPHRAPPPGLSRTKRLDRWVKF